MKYLLLLLLLVPLATHAGEQSVAKELYVEDAKDEIASIMGKIGRGSATEYDQFKLDKLSSRVTEATQVGSRIIFTDEIVDREPHEALDSATKDCGEIVLFTEILNQSGRTVTHVWYADGVEVYTQSFKIGGDRWRVWSAKAVRQSERLTVLIYADDDLIAATGIDIL
jgi:hypothetical protein